jgi:uncharacterized GH25 family protein
MRKNILAIICLTGLTFLASAHEFWLEPDRFYFKTGENARINVKVGEDFSGEAWNATTDKVARLQHYSGQQVRDLKKSLMNDSTERFQLSLVDEGTHVITLETSESFTAMDGAKFTEYLEADGLDDVLYQRKKNGISGDSATELYSRHAKLILHAGAKTDNSYSRICNLPIEIIPDENPALLKKGRRIGFRILFEGKPLFGAKVKVWNRYNHRTSVQNIFSQQDGRIETHVSNPGVWMVSVVRMVPSKDRKAQYRSYWGTLVFGVR